MPYFDTNGLLPSLKNELPFLKDAPSQTLQQELKDLDVAFKRAGNPKLGGREWIVVDGLRINRDINGARGIFLRALVDLPALKRALLTKVNENGSEQEYCVSKLSIFL